MTEQNRVQWVYEAKTNEDLAKRYDEWAADYDTDLARDFDWSGHILCAETLAKYMQPTDSIIDVGCGTGLCAAELSKRGFTTIDGFDLSEAMLALAADLNIYGDLQKGVLGEKLSYPTASYGAAVASGVFSVSHAPASGWDEVARIVKPGGFFVLTVRPDVFESNGFKEKEAELVKAKKWELVDESDPKPLLPKGEPDILHQIRVYKILS